jgi:hypothetical protein
MIIYESESKSKEKPELYKKYVVDNEELMSSPITPKTKSELPNINEDIIYQHMVNLKNYIKEKAKSLKLEEKGKWPEEPYPLLGWSALVEVNEELSEWWHCLIHLEEKDSQEEASE